MNKYEVESLIKSIKEIKLKAIELIKWMALNDKDCLMIFNKKYYYKTSFDCDICEEGVDITFDEYWSYGGHETHDYGFPLSAFCEDGETEWKVDFLEKLETKNEKHLAQLKAKFDMGIIRRKEEYEKLKEEFEQ